MAALVAHLEYAIGDSLAGPSIAAKDGSPAIDVNIRTCRAKPLSRRRRRIVCAHSSRWWEHGYEPKPGTKVPRKPIEQLTDTQVGNLWSKIGHHGIPTAEAYFAECARVGVIPLPEMKPSTWTAGPLRHLKNHAAAIGVPWAVMTVQRYGKTKAAEERWQAAAYARLELATQLDIPTVLIRRGRRPNAARWTRVVTAVKSGLPWRGVITTRALIRRLERQYR